MSIRLVKISEIVIVILILANLFEVGIYFKVRHDAHLYDPRVPFPLPSGFLIDGSFMASEGTTCSVLRVSSDNCPFCRADQSQYGELVQRAQQRGCRSVLLAPKLGWIQSKNNRGGTLQLQYVDMKFGSALNPFLTPATMLLDGSGRLLWDQEGSMNADSLNDALYALKKIH